MNFHFDLTLGFPPILTIDFTIIFQHSFNVPLFEIRVQEFALEFLKTVVCQFANNGPQSCVHMKKTESNLCDNMHKNHMSRSEHQKPFPTLHAPWFIDNQNTHLSDENSNLFFHLIDCFFLARKQNIKRKMEQNETQILVESPFKNNSSLFNNKDMFPDMEFVVPGLERPLLLHKGIMAKTSKFVQGLLKAKETAKSGDANRIEWPFDTTNKVDRDALVKVLRFCDDETMTVKAKGGELCAVIAAMCRLQVTCLQEMVAKLTQFAVKQSENDVSVGVEMLKETQLYAECRNPNTVELDKALAKVVLTPKSISEHFENVVNNCLMMLPMEYLDMAEYGEAHTQFSEFGVRAQYVKEHGDALSKADQEMIMKKCDWTLLLSDELKELKKLNVVGQDVMIDLCNQVLANTEKEIERRSQVLQNTAKEGYEDKERIECTEQASVSYGFDC